jgi:sarcosine oxidase subunit alpha
MLSPIRRGPLHEVQKRARAVHRSSQGWQLATAYPAIEESVKAARHREAHAAWTDVAMADISHLGRLDLQGPDAAVLLSRAFGDRTELAPGRLRPALLTREGGIALASVLGWCLAPQHFLLTMTAGSFAMVRARLSRLVTESERPLRVCMTEVTDEWGGVALMGPKAESLLTASLPMSVMGENLPQMAFRDFTQDDLPVRIARINLAIGTGFEIYTRAGYADILWNLLLEKGKAHPHAHQ